MSFEIMQPGSVPTLPQLEGLYGLAPTDAGLGILPALLIGGVAASSAIAAWLHMDDWDIGTYNNMVRRVDDLVHEIDELGWTDNCWKENPSARKSFERFWSRWSKHYGEYGIIGECFDFSKKYTCYVPDGAEVPIRKDFLPELDSWVKWVEKTCHVKRATPTPGTQEREKSDTTAIKVGVGLGAGSVLLLLGVGLGGMLLLRR
jgi:hypothetical protein